METYLATAAVLALALSLGGALCSIGTRGRGWDWLAPSIGLSAAMLLAWIAIRLPGNATTAAVVLAVAVAAAAAVVVRRSAWRPLAAGAPAALIVTALSSLPFIASDRVGVIGESLNDDLAFHLDWAYALARGGLITGRIPDDYPMGPHALVGSLAEGLGTSAEPVFTGLVLAVPILMALTALAAFEDVPAPARVLAAPLVGCGYLAAGLLAQSSFKELLLGSFVLAFAVVVRRLLRSELSARRAAVLTALLAAAACTSFSLAALAWFAAGGAAAAAAQLVLARGREGLRAVLLAGAGLACFAVAAVAALKLAGFFAEGPGRYAFSRGATGVVGNLSEPLSPLQALGVWPSGDFRIQPGGKAWRLGVALAGVAVAAGLVRAAMRREVALLGVAGAAAAIYGLAVVLSNPYNDAKALAIAAPVLTAAALAGLLGGPARSGPARLAPLALAGVWGLLALHSSATLLRAAPVRPDGQSSAVRAVADFASRDVVAFVGNDAFARWELRGSGHVFSGGTADLSGSPGALRPVPVPELATWLIASSSRHGPTPGPAWRPVRRTRWYTLFRRRGPTRSLAVAREGSAPGAVLSCRDAATRRLARRGWVALVKPRPVAGAGGSWADPAGRLPSSGGGVTLLGLERTLRQELPLPAGEWEVSLRYSSHEPLTVTVGSLRRVMPPYLADRSRFWRVGIVRGGGAPLAVSVTGGESRPIQPRRPAELFEVAAVRAGPSGELVPLRRACGRYTDFVTPPGTAGRPR